MAASRCVLMPYLQRDAAFFLPEHDAAPFLTGRAAYIPCIRQLRVCARIGCPLCTILMASVDISYGPHEILSNITPVRLVRAILDPHQSVQLVVCADDCSRTYFYRVPSEWQHLPLAKLDHPNHEHDIIKSWLKNCLTDHKKCATNLGQDAFCPTRLLDLRAFKGSDDVRVVQDVHSVEWVALSHCWGPASLHPISTTDSTLTERTTRIPFSSLSRTFQDAARTTRELGYRFLWIDSLCIIQDNKSDWDRESSLMAEVYGRSTLTLCALSSENSTQGCRVNGMRSSTPGQTSRYADFPIGDQRIRFFESSPTYWHQECGDDPYKFEGFSRVWRNPLNTRAWTLQERELSPRKVHFSENMLLWECATMKASSELPWLERVFDEDNVPEPIALPGETDLALDGAARLRDQWYSLVEDYSSRFMTKEADKLVGLRGLILKYCQLSPTMEEVAGMWKEHLPASLLWQSWPYDHKTHEGMGPSFLGAFYPRRPMAQRAPSWSWASLDGMISYQSQRITAGVARIPIAENLARVVSCLPRIPAVASETQGEAVLTLIGRLACVRFDYEPIRSQTRWIDDLRPLKSEAGCVLGAFFPDIVTEVQFLENIFCLMIQNETYNSVLEEPSLLRGDGVVKEEEYGSYGLTMGLALVKHGVDTYKRVGLVRWMKPILFNGINEQIVKVV